MFSADEHQISFKTSRSEARFYFIMRINCVSAEEIRCVFDDNSKISFSNLHQNLCCGCSQHRFL